MRGAAAYYAANPNVSVQPVGSAFQLALAKSSGLIASPSPGVVIQALGCGKPCYLFVPVSERGAARRRAPAKTRNSPPSEAV